MFLQILGLIFLVIICVVAYFAWKKYSFSEKEADSEISLAMSVLPAMVMELEPSNAQEWKEFERLKQTESELKKIGATHVGFYRVYNGLAIIRVCIWNFKDQAVAVIYESHSELDEENASFIYEVSCKLNDGSVCITSNHHAVYESRPKNHKIIFKESNSILDLIKALKSELPKGEKVQRIKDPKSYFLESYEEISEWGWRPEQIRSDKTQQVLSSAGVTSTEELIDELVEIGTSYSVEVNINRARRALAKHSKMSAGQWEKIKDKLVFINESMQLDHLVVAVYDIAGELSEAQEQVLDEFQANTENLVDPISAFQMLIQTLNLKVKRVTSMDIPVKTAVYLPL